MYELKEQAYERPSGIDCKFYMPDQSRTDSTDILVVSFSGVYPDGSLGNKHGFYIALQTMFGVHAFDPDCIILDFRNLEYRWGNTLLKVFQDISDVKDSGKNEEEPFFPVLAVTSQKCEAAFLSLVTPSGHPKPDWCFNNIDQAIEIGVRKAKEWLDF